VLPKEHRLTDNRDFKTVFATGKTYVHRLVILKVRPVAGKRPGRWGFSTSSKLGKAVIRNRAKRLLRESVRVLLGQLRRTGYDVVLVARLPIRETTFAELSQVIAELLKKAGLFETDSV